MSKKKNLIKIIFFSKVILPEANIALAVRFSMNGHKKTQLNYAQAINSLFNFLCKVNHIKKEKSAWEKPKVIKLGELDLSACHEI